MIVLGLDPGKNNFGFSVINIENIGYQVIRTGTFEHSIRSFGDSLYDCNGKSLGKNVQVPYTAFKAEILDFFASIPKPDAIIMERYQNRGIMSGVLNELLPFSMGIIVNTANELGIHNICMVMASGWKNMLGGNDTLKKMHKTMREYFVKQYKNSFPSEVLYAEADKLPHCLDSALMTLMYGAGMTDDRMKFLNDQEICRLMEQIIDVVIRSKTI